LAESKQYMNRSYHHLMILILVTIVGTGLRLYHLDGASFWLDEGFSVNFAQHPSLWTRENHPPLYYAMLAAWSLLSHSDYWLRLLSVIFGVATIPVVYTLGRKLFGPTAALWSAAVLAVLSMHVQYSQEARMYTLMALLFACGLLALVGAARENSWNHWLTYIIASTLLAYSHGAGVIYVMVLAMLFPLCAKSLSKATDWVPWLLSNAVVVVLFLPWLGVYMQRVHSVVQNFWVPVPRWSDPLLVLRDLTVASIPSMHDMFQNHIGVILPMDLPNWILVLPVALVLFWAIVRSGSNKSWEVRTLVAAYVLPILLIFLLSLGVKSIFLGKVFLPTAIPIALLVGSVGENSAKQVAWGRTILTLTIMLLLVGTFYSLRYMQKEEWRESSQFLQQSVAPGDVIVYKGCGSIGKSLINRYDTKSSLRNTVQFDFESEVNMCDNRDIIECLDRSIENDNPSTVWIVRSHDQHDADRGIFLAWMKRHFAEEVPGSDFLGIQIERFTLVGK
jgi:mannosyltransferase